MRAFMRKRWLWGLALMMLAGLAACAMHRRAYHAMDLSDPDRARSQGRPIPVRTATVTSTTFEQVIGATALTAASNEAVVRAVSPGQGTNTVDMILKAIHVKEGDRVKKGQLLF